MRLILFFLVFLTFLFSFPNYWYKLLHYKKTLFSYESLIDDKNFFISQNGKTNPQKEFIESIKLIKSNPSKFACKFPLRYLFLNKEYNLSTFDLTSCKKLQKFLQEVNASKVNIVFADASMNKPASMFGHTFIRFDKKSFSPLISNVVNYAARVTDTNGIVFAFKGIFGYYHGYYSLLPYYKKIKQYNDIESRDLWEYELNLTKNEIYKMILHVWELRNIYSDYYFFKENCAYNILYLIDVAKDTNFTDEFVLDAIPLDTVKILKKYNLIKSSNFRPSLQTEILNISKPIKNKLIIIKISRGEYDLSKFKELNITESQKARILDTSVKYLQYLSKKELINRQIYIKRLLKILKIRSKINYISNYKYPKPFDPLYSHNSKRLIIGKRNNEYIFGFRFAYHSLEDNIKGYKKGFSLNFGDFRFSYKKNFKIQKIGIIELLSLSDRNIFFKPISWKVNFGFYREHIKDKKKLILKVNPGGGFMKRYKQIYYYSLFETELDYNNYFNKNYNLGLGLSVGAFSYFKDNFFQIFLLTKNYFIEKNKQNIFKIEFSHYLTNQLSINLSLMREKTYNRYYSTYSILLYRYF